MNVPAPVATPGRAPRATGWWLRTILALMGALASLGVLALALGAMLDATRSAFAMIGAMVWTTFGPHLFLAAFAAALASWPAWKRSPRRFGATSAAFAVAAMVASAAIVTQIIRKTHAAGGDIDLFRSVMIAPMTAPAPDQTETFLTVEGEALQAAIYKPPGTQMSAPVLVYIHGGGFMGGSRTETAADLRWFADRGWLVFSIDYRLFKPGRPTWDKAPLDVACGLAWSAENAPRFGGARKKIVLMGDSAGGNLAVNLGYDAARQGNMQACGLNVPVPAGIAVQYPAVDVRMSYERGYPVPGFEPKMLMSGYIGGAPDEFPDRIKAITSANFISAKAPRTLIIAPANDSLVVPAGVLGFARQARQGGVNVELVRMPFANHIFNQIAANSLGNQAGRSIRLRFLLQVLRSTD